MSPFFRLYRLLYRRVGPRCHTCGGRGVLPAGGGGRWVKCATCGSSFRATRRGVTEIKVWGENANEVQAVIRQLAADDAARREAARLRSPWFSGLFYLMVAVVIISLLLVVGRLSPWWAFPLVVLGTVLLVAVVGALQMRQDDHLTERGFLRLMGDVLRRLPLVVPRAVSAGADPDPEEDSAERSAPH